MGYWGPNAKRAYHHTAPVNALYALHESLVMLQEEGLENAWARHTSNHLALRAGIEALGLSFVVDEAHRLPQLNSVTVFLTGSLELFSVVGNCQCEGEIVIVSGQHDLECVLVCVTWKWTVL